MAREVSRYEASAASQKGHEIATIQIPGGSTPDVSARPAPDPLSVPALGDEARQVSHRGPKRTEEEEKKVKKHLSLQSPPPLQPSAVLCAKLLFLRSFAARSPRSETPFENEEKTRSGSGRRLILHASCLLHEGHYFTAWLNLIQYCPQSGLGTIPCPSPWLRDWPSLP